MKNKIANNEGEPLNVNKKITPKLFEYWKRNPLENIRLKQSEGGSEKTTSEVQKPTKAKGKRKVETIVEEASQGSVAPEVRRDADSTAD